MNRYGSLISRFGFTSVFGWGATMGYYETGQKKGCDFSGGFCLKPEECNRDI